MTERPRPAIPENAMEKVYALATVRWLAEQEPGETWESAMFEGDFEDGWCFMEIYLEQPVAPGETVDLPIALYNSRVPIERLLCEGAGFRVGGPHRDPEALGRITRVVRSGLCEPGSPFHSVLKTCQMPTSEVLGQALSARDSLAEEPADHINYLACFTHYREAAPLLSRFGIQRSVSPTALLDSRRKTVHLKVLLNNPRSSTLGLYPVVVAHAHGSHVFRNWTCSRGSNGAYLPRCAEKGPDGNWLIDPREYMDPAEVGVYEIVTSYRSGHTTGDGYQVVVHADTLPMNNIGANLERMFCNASAIIATPYWNRDYTLSYEWLAECPAIHQTLANAFWLIIETGDVRATVDFVENLGAEYRVTPFAKDRRDYLDEAEAILLERLR